MKTGKKLKIHAFAALLLIASICYVSTLVKTGNAADTLPTMGPLVYVYPSSITANVGDTITVAVIAYNLTSGFITDPYLPTTVIYLGDLYGFDIQFSWDPAVIQYVNYTNPDATLPGGYTGYTHPNVTAPIEKYPNPVAPSPHPGIVYGYGSSKDLIWIINIVNETGNMPNAASSNVKAWFAAATISPAATFNGNGTLFVMAFRILSEGSSLLKIEDCVLANVDGNPIGRSSGVGREWLNPPRNGIVHAVVIPEFTSTLLSLFMMASACALVLKKRKLRNKT